MLQTPEYIIIIAVFAIFHTDFTYASGLTVDEISKFRTENNYGASVTVHEEDSSVFFISASGLPDHPTERVNPNDPTAQNYNISILRTPEMAPVPGCVGLGMIGMARTGVAIYNPLDGFLDNAVEGSSPETFDSCDGHASPNGAYHYHKLPDSCLYKHEVDEFIGVALDGFPIYGPRVSQTQNISESELDKCHGKFVNGRYRYYVTDKFPYFMGCFKGRVINSNTRTFYNCTTDNSPWNRESYGYNYYLCHCPMNNNGGGGRPECAPSNPNRPSDCPNCHVPDPPPGCPPRPPPTDMSTLPSQINTTVNSSDHVTGMRRECAPNMPNRPHDCPDCSGNNPPPGCPTATHSTGISTRASTPSGSTLLNVQDDSNDAILMLSSHIVYSTLLIFWGFFLEELVG